MATIGAAMHKQITSLQNALVKHLVHLRQNSDYRHEHKSVVIEGIKMVQEIGPGCAIKNLLVSDPSLIPHALNPIETYLVDEAVMKKISGVLKPEGIIAEVEMPKFSNLEKSSFIIALDNVSDPGNQGTILRTALAFGWDGVFLLGEGCDPFNEKSLRASRGATFKLPIATGSWKQLEALAARMQIKPLVANLEGISLDNMQKTEKCILVLGNEAHGPSAEVLAHCQKIAIPMPGHMESLNVAVAGGILMYVLRK